MFAYSALALAAVQQSFVARTPRDLGGHVLVVGPGHIPDVQTAVDLAASGDTVLVKSGTYAGFSLVGKGLHVTADSEATVVIEGSVVVQLLPQGRSALLAGLTVNGATDAPALLAKDDAGGLRVEGCSFLGRDGDFEQLVSTPGETGVSVENGANVALVMCTSRGGKGAFYSTNNDSGGPGAVAVRSIASSLAVQECVLVGGDGNYGNFDHNIGGAGNGGTGGAGLSIADGFLYAIGSDIRGGAGGAGGDHLDNFCFGGGGPGNGGAGGAGIVVTHATVFPNAYLLGNTLTPGTGGRGGFDFSDAGGYPCWGDGFAGADGAPIDAPAGVVELLTGVPRRVIAPRVVREGTTTTIRAYGEPGDVVQILAGRETDFVYVPTFRGVQLVQSSQSVLLASGTIPASGGLAIDVPFAGIPTDSRPFFLQGYFRDPSNQRFLASQVTLIEVGPQF